MVHGTLSASLCGVHDIFLIELLKLENIPMLFFIKLLCMTEYIDSDLFEVRNLVLGEEIFPFHVGLALSFTMYVICLYFKVNRESSKSWNYLVFYLTVTESDLPS